MNWLIFIGIIVVIMGGASFAAIYVTQQQEQRQRNLTIITKNKITLSKDDGKEKQLARQRADIAKKLKEAGKDGGVKKDKVTVKQLLQQAGFEKTPPARYWIYSTIFAAIEGLFLKLMTDWPPIAIVLLTFTAFLGMPKFFLKWKAGKRQSHFLEDFPDALDASVRLLQAGMPISEAIAMTSREYTGPIREEMARIYENQKIGVALGAAALEMAHRIPLTEVHMFATALQIQSETGSSLSEVLSNLSNVIRARFRLKRKVKALSSEAKSSAAIIGALPVLVTLGLHFANPDYIALLYTTPKGKFLATCAVGWMLCGILVMRQMINFKV